MKRRLAVLSICLAIFLLQIKPVPVTSITGMTVEVHPSEGDITTEIYVLVRGEPYHVSPGQTFLYLFWDDKLVAERLPSIFHEAGPKSWYEQSWDLALKPPNEYPLSELGTHEITVVIESTDGTKAVSLATFDIVRYFPPPELWELLPQDFIDRITGPRGTTGAMGPQGPAGEKAEIPFYMWAMPIVISTISLVCSLLSYRNSRKTKRRKKN